MTGQRGGAARAALRLHDALCDDAMDSMVYSKDGRGVGSGRIYGFRAEEDVISRVNVRVRKYFIERAYHAYAESKPDGLDMYSDDRSAFGAQVVKQLPACDIINLHWVARFVDYSSFFHLVRRPVVWTLHDMNAFTGGCHYASGCLNFHDMCGACPQLGSGQKNDLSHAIWQRKSAVLSAVAAGDLHIVTPSRWLQQEAQASALFRDLPISVIPNGIKTDVFLPRNTMGFRTSLNIPEDAKVVLFVADDVSNERKGVRLLMQAMQKISSTKDLFFISVGNGNIEHNLPNHISFGGIASDLLMSIAYSMADVFVIPSLEDNLPNTVLESMACGTPVVGFDLGGIPDMVRHGQTGLLVEALNVAGLCQAIEALLKDKTLREDMSRQCRSVAVAEYDERIQARRYAELYQSILELPAQRAKQ